MRDRAPRMWVPNLRALRGRINCPSMTVILTTNGRKDPGDGSPTRSRHVSWFMAHPGQISLVIPHKLRHYCPHDLDRSRGEPMKLSKLLLFSVTIVLTLPAASQNASQNAASSLAASAPTSVPPLVPYSGAVNSESGPTNASVTFLIYSDELGGEPLFSETQSVAVDPTGHFKTQIGATLTNGLPIDLFASGEARWLAVQIAGEPAQPRVLLASVPYALKAADAATLGGLPASAFALAGVKSFAAGPTITPNTAINVTTTGGVAGYLAEFSGASSIVDSPVFMNGANVGIGITTPVSPLDVNGTVTATGLTMNGNSTFNGIALFPAQGTATASTGYHSQYFKMSTSAYNSSTKAVVDPRFLLQAEPVGNNTASPSATFNLLSSAASAAPTETGFYFNANGTIHFAPGQTFPGGTGTGTITGVTAGTALQGGGTSGSVTLNLDTTKVPLLAASNIFSANQTITESLGVYGTASAGTVNAITNYGYYLAGLPFAFGSPTTQSAYLGFAGNSSSTGADNTASGYQALFSNTTGYYNTATGFGALRDNSTGYDNVADGIVALSDNTIGYENTASGFDALGYNSTGHDNVGVGYSSGLPSDFSPVTGSDNTTLGAFTTLNTGSLSNATAIGAYAQVNQSNTLVLGCSPEVNNCPAAVSVGIGTPAPDATLTVNGNADKSGGGSWGTYSDGRLKTVNGSFGSGLDQVMQLRPIRYRYKPNNGMGIRDADEHIGVVAQEVQRVIPEAVTENGRGYLLVNNDPIIWSMVNAIKEQQREIEQQQKLLLAERTVNEQQAKLLRAQSAVNEQQGKMLRAESAEMKSLAAEVRETRKTLREVKAQVTAGQAVMVASK